MNKQRIQALFISLSALVLAAGAQAGTVTPVLQESLAGRGSGDAVPVLVRFTDQPDIALLRKDVAQTLKALYPDPKERKARRTALERSRLVDGLKNTARNSIRLLLPKDMK